LVLGPSFLAEERRARDALPAAEEEEAALSLLAGVSSATAFVRGWGVAGAAPEVVEALVVEVAAGVLTAESRELRRRVVCRS
jgi:hypothetical protein